MFESTKYNWKMYRVLKRLSEQRVSLILQPNNVWLVENAIHSDEETEAHLRTCFMRGWIEPIVNEIPKGTLQPDGTLPPGPIFQSSGPLWRLTDSGWSAINRSHQFVILGLFLSALGLFVAIKT